MREILVYDDYEIHKLGGGTQYEEVTTEKATSIYVTDVAKPKGKLIPFGRTEQVQYQGYNLFNYAQVVNLAYGTRQGESSSYILGSSLYRGYYIPVTPGEHYFVSRKNTTDFNRFRYCYTEIEPAGNVPVISESQKIRDTYTSFDTVVPEGAGYLFLYLTNEETDITPEMEVQITKSEELLPYEPYVGGTASPSPDFPQEIRNVEGRSCRNLFDEEWTGSVSTNFIPVFAGKHYRYSERDKGLSMNYRFYENMESSEYTTKNISESNYYTPEKDGYVKLYKPNTSKTECQLEEGTVVTPYEPYFEGKRLEFNVIGKNLCQAVYPGYYFIDNGILVENNAYRTFIVKNLPAGDYIFSTNLRDCRILRIWKDNLSSNISSDRNTHAFTTSQAGKVMITVRNVSSTEITENVLGQIEEGTIASTYIEHQQQTILFPMQEGQKLMEGDYLADDGVHHVWMKDTIDSPTIFSRNTAYDNSYSYFTRKYINIVKAPSESASSNNIYCNKLKGRIDHSPSSARISNAGYVIFDMPKTEDYEDINKFRNKIQEAIDNGDPYIIQIPLAQEVIDPYTEAQQEAYNKLKNLMLYKGVNHIWTETDGLEPNLQLTYKRVKQEGVLQVSNIQPLNNLELNNTEETPEELTPEIYEE